jgi:alkylation response protein AidB-like acyl-CoA dehydrogenase
MEVGMLAWPDLADGALVKEVRGFVLDCVQPEADRIDREDFYPTHIVKESARRGFNTITLPAELGGRGGDYTSAVALFEELGYGSAAVGICLITIFQAQTIIRLFGCDSLKARYLPKFSQGLISSYALTETNHGSDIRSLSTKARKDGHEWVLTGEKAFITSGAGAEFFIILAETSVGVSVFAVPKELPGLTTYVGENSATFGLRNGPHVNLRLDGVRVPLDHLIGVEGKGVRQAVTTLDYSRTLAAAISIGIARAALDHAGAYAAGRVAFDQPVIDFQGIQWYFAELMTEIDSARLLVYHAAKVLNGGSHADMVRFSSEAKLKASSVAVRAANIAIQVCGAYGTTVNAPLNRFFRDAKTYEIGGGSSEVLKNTIGRHVSKSFGKHAV